MTEQTLRVPLHESVFTRLVAVTVIAAVSLLLIVSGCFAYLIGPYMGRSVYRLAWDYAELLAASAPDEAAARRVAQRLDIQTRYEGPRGAWTTAATLPSIADALAGAEPGDWDVVTAAAPGGGHYVIGWTHNHRMRRAHDKLLWATLAMVLAVVIAAHLVIRSALRPLRTLHDGVVRLSEGQLDVAIPSATRDEFGALAEAFNAMVRRVSEMVRTRDQLLLDVSHELRSPLTRMKVALAMLPEGEKTARMNADLAEMEAMIAELLELERLREGRGVRVAPQDLVPLLREAAAPFAGVPPGVELAAAGPLVAQVDADRVRVVLRNLLENAVKYSLPDSRPVSVSAARQEGAVVVRVRDDGPGIPEDDLQKVFEPFFRVDRSRSKKTGGYGLGLSICKRIMEAHGGDIRAENGPGRGATFVLTFPPA